MNSVPMPGERSVLVWPGEDMVAYDQLLPPIREALATHPRDLSAANILTLWNDEAFHPELNCLGRMALFLDVLTARS